MVEAGQDAKNMGGFNLMIFTAKMEKQSQIEKLGMRNGKKL